MRWGSPNRFLLHAATPPDKNSCRSNSHFFASTLAGHIEMSVKRLQQEASLTDTHPDDAAERRKTSVITLLIIAAAMNNSIGNKLKIVNLISGFCYTKVLSRMMRVVTLQFCNKA
ncbi:hypothetical protein [Pseudomonas chlororaphis]|uniref:hypothetical protein n=1 Tax=Pseudomonas chlororaphis TaxID=587753 RepID=UPI0039E6122C